MIIRKAVKEDARLIIQAHIRSIREVCSSEYTVEQVKAWSGRDFQVSRWQQTMDHDHVWVISNDQKEIFGFGHLSFPTEEEAYLAGLYFVPEVIGLGFGKQMMELMLNEVNKRQTKMIKLNATKTALKFYLKAGFSVDETSFIMMSDQKIDCINMHLQL